MKVLEGYCSEEGLKSADFLLRYTVEIILTLKLLGQSRPLVGIPSTDQHRAHISNYTTPKSTLPYQDEIWGQTDASGKKGEKRKDS